MIGGAHLGARWPNQNFKNVAFDTFGTYEYER